MRTRSPSHRFSFTFARAMTTATALPSGEICGSLRLAMRNRSDGCHRSACAATDTAATNNTTMIRFINTSSGIPATRFGRKIIRFRGAQTLRHLRYDWPKRSGPEIAFDTSDRRVRSVSEMPDDIRSLCSRCAGVAGVDFWLERFGAAFAEASADARGHDHRFDSRRDLGRDRCSLARAYP